MPLGLHGSAPAPAPAPERSSRGSPPFLQAYVRSHINTGIYVVDFLKHAKAHDGEKRQVEELIVALTRLLTQVTPWDLRTVAAPADDPAG